VGNRICAGILVAGLLDHLKAKNVEEALIMGAGLASLRPKGGRPYDNVSGRSIYPDSRCAGAWRLLLAGGANGPNDEC